MPTKFSNMRKIVAERKYDINKYENLEIMHNNLKKLHDIMIK